MSIYVGLEGGSVVPAPSSGGGANPRTDVEWLGMSPTWTGWDGSVWDLSGRSGGIALMTGGIRGLNMPPVERYTDMSPAVAGSRFRGFRTQDREVFWPLVIYGQPDSVAWMNYDRAFWRTMDPARPGVWSVTHPDGAVRSLKCRFMDDGGQTFDRFPTRMGWARYGITLVAEDPYWTGQPIVRIFEEIPPQQFYGGNDATKATPFYISHANTLTTAALDNPGDVSAYPTFTISGPTESVSIGVSGQRTTVPFTIPAGQSLTIDTAPAGQVAIDSAGKDRTSELGSVAFVPVPAGLQVPLAITMTGTGRVTATLSPRFYRAW